MKNYISWKLSVAWWLVQSIHIIFPAHNIYIIYIYRNTSYNNMKHKVPVILICLSLYIQLAYITLYNVYITYGYIFFIFCKTIYTYTIISIRTVIIGVYVYGLLWAKNRKIETEVKLGNKQERYVDVNNFYTVLNF